jgi:hypothetical protein
MVNIAVNGDHTYHAFVIAGLFVLTIHVFTAAKAWMPGTRARA